MSERAETGNLEGQDRNLAPVVPIRGKRELPVPAAPDTAAVSKLPAAAGYGGAMDRATRSYSALAEKSSALFSHLRCWAKRERNKNPLLIAGIVAGAAFVVGVALRVYRSNR